jgi:DNA mismatch repair protein MutS
MSVTPIRRQYLRIKEQHPGAIVFFRLGDFYETFDDDARITARELEIVLTSREMGKGHKIPMAGIPYHALENYLSRLISRGYKVAICEQLTPPGHGLVAREVVRVVTPGTVVEPSLLNGKKNNYLAAVVSDGENAGLAYVDASTGEFATTQLAVDRIPAELERIGPSELLVMEGGYHPDGFNASSITELEEFWFDIETANKTLLEHFGVVTLDGYGCSALPLATRAAGAALHYIETTDKTAAAQVEGLMTYSTEAYMVLDPQTRRNLELFRNLRTGEAAGSLLSVLDATSTPMGGRLLGRWLGQPLLDPSVLGGRQDAVGWCLEHTSIRKELRDVLSSLPDLERLMNRISGDRASPLEVVRLASGLKAIPTLKGMIVATLPLEHIEVGLKPCSEAVGLIGRAIEAEPGTLDTGKVIQRGFSPELDDLRDKAGGGRDSLAALERKERERTGIKSLKVGYNRVFGYYIEVSSAYKEAVPVEYVRKQTLTSGERYFTPELKEYESLVLTAQERLAELERALFGQVCRQVSSFARAVLSTARAVGELDAILSLADVAARHGYVRPEIGGNAISIKEGRHPVVERSLPEGSFVPNDTDLAPDSTQLVILTGPNMSGKSTYLRQVALIVLMAQVGSFVPASAAKVGLVDRIFTRIGAQEDLAAGQSTFMVEMVETATILNNATSRSLVILDEVGRGTSTYDGMSIAWAVVEYIHNHPRLGAKTLFATHYHELVELATVLPRVRNFNVVVTEEQGKVVFLRRIVPGATDKSYGIHVAELAGLPSSVLRRAQEILLQLEGEPGRRPHPGATRKESVAGSAQLPLFESGGEVAKEIAALDVESLSPLAALTKLYELKKMIQAKNQAGRSLKP